VLTSPRRWQDIPLWADVTADDWSDWKWQFRNRITKLEQLEQLISLDDEERAGLIRGKQLFRFGITPHYATLIDADDPACPMRRQAVPHNGETLVAPFESADPLHEDEHAPVPGLVHRYPDRVLFLVTHECPLYCRYCTRRRLVGDQQAVTTPMLEQALAYIAATPEIRDVLISGGEPLALSDRRLEWLLERLRAMPHVEIVRIGTRMPVVMPQRITENLVTMLRRHHPLWLNTHFNHPFELAPIATRQAMERLADAGIPTGNQSVLLRGINDCPVVMRKLVHELVKVRCRPYYIYNCDLSEGLSHFRTPVETGVAIVEALRGHTSGYAVPTFVVDSPRGGGKIPLSPDYVFRRHDGHYTLRNFQDETFEYEEHAPIASATGPCAACGTLHESVEGGRAAARWQRGAIDAG
jgi:lysine 2,3-aminomutase